MNTHEPDFDACVDDISSAGAVDGEDRSLTDDIVALLDDGKTYVESELQYQKTRAAFASPRGERGRLTASSRWRWSISRSWRSWSAW